MKKYFYNKIALLLIFMLGVTIQSFAQAPANDDPCSAIALTADASCNLVEYTNEDATAFGGTSPSCGFYQGADVWFTVTVPASGELIIDTSPGTNSSPQVAVYTGTCSSLTLYDCNDFDSENGGNVGRLTFNDISLAGTEFHICVFRRSSIVGGTFEICAWEPVIPDYDLCANPVALTVEASCIFTEYTNLNCTDYDESTDASCGFDYGVDVWFTVTVPASGKLIIDLNPGTNTNPAIAIFQGSCGSLVEYACNQYDSDNGGNVGRITLNDISLAGVTFYVKIHRRASVQGGTFGICAWEPFIPDNDFCANAVSLTVESECTFANYTNANCTDVDESIDASCGFDFGADVWFTVTIPASGKLILDLNPGTNTQPQIALFQGSCGSLTSFACNQSDSENGNSVGRITLNDLSIAGETMYIKVWRRASVQGGTFDICAWEPIIPDNDFCANAVALTVDSECNYSSYTNLHCTDSDESTNAPCGFDYGVDVWFTLTVPASGKMIVDLNSGTNTKPQVALFQGTCGSFTSYACDGGNSENGNQVGRININDISVAGETMYVKVFTRASVQGGTFGICAWEPFIPDNDFCINAVEILVGDTCSFTEYTNLHCTDLDEPTNAPCGFDYGVDVWFTLTIPASGQLVVDLNPGTNTSPAVAMFHGTCGALTPYVCDDQRSENGTLVGKITINDPSVGGETMFLKVWRRANIQGGTFGICAWEPEIPVNDLCAGAIELTVQGVECNLQTYTNENCTDSEIETPIPDPSCSFYSGVDVWFKTTVPSDGQLILDLGPIDYNQISIAVYTGVCGSLIEYACDDNSSENGFIVGKIIIADPSIADDEIYVRVWHRASYIGGEFQICAFNPNYCGFFDVAVGTQGTCNPIEESYTQDVTFSYLNAPITGDVLVNGQTFPITASPMTVTLTGLPSNNQSIDLLIEFSDDIQCYYLDDNAWFAPICCEGDANYDGQVNVLDLIAISSDFGCTGLCDGDVNVDGEVNILDLIAVSSNFGNNCLE